MLRTGHLLAPFQGLCCSASTADSHPTPGAALPGALAPPRAGLAPAGHRELVARLRHIPSPLFGVRAAGRTLRPEEVAAWRCLTWRLLIGRMVSTPWAEGIEAIVFRTVGDPPSLWESILPGELLVLPAELARVDRLLDDPVFFVPFAPHFDARVGRPSIPVETYLRLMFLK